MKLFLLTFVAVFGAGCCNPCDNPDLNAEICQIMSDKNLCSTSVAEQNCYRTCHPKECDATPCDTLPEIAENGFRLPEGGAGHTAGDRVTYHCNTGYLLEGVTSNECRLNHTWTSSEAPVCRELCPAPPTEPGMEVETIGENSVENSRAIYHCVEAGARMIGNSLTICGRNGSGNLVWSLDPSTLSCNITNACSAPPMIPSGGINPEPRRYHDREWAQYDCHQHYTLVGINYNACRDGNWIFMGPLCAKDCEDRVANATCLVYKNRGYCNLSHVREACLKTCEACGSCTNDPPLNQNVNVTVSGPYTGGQIVGYTCSVGAVDEIDENVCLGNNEWGFPSPTCVDK